MPEGPGHTLVAEVHLLLGTAVMQFRGSIGRLTYYDNYDAVQAIHPKESSEQPQQLPS